MLSGGLVHEVGDEHLVRYAGELGVTVDDRVPVVASGSNAAPARLADKCGGDADIPVRRVSVESAAVVYSAHVTRYGSVPAMLLADAATTSRLHVPLLDRQQLEMVDRSEGSYERRVLSHAAAGLEGLQAYESRWGSLVRDRRPVRIDEVMAESTLPAMSQIEALGFVAQLTAMAASGIELSERVVSGSLDPAEVNRRLREVTDAGLGASATAGPGPAAAVRPATPSGQ